MLALACAFAVIFCKEIFGGTGMNIFNVAVGARMFLFFSYPLAMSGDKVWVAKDAIFGLGNTLPDGFTAATPLGQLAQGSIPSASLCDSIIGFIPGCIGETSVIAIAIGAIILLWTGITSMEHEVSQFFDSFSIEADESQYQEKLYELRTKAHDYSRFNEQIGKRAKTKADYEKAKASLDEYLSLYGYDSAAEYTQTLSQMKKQLAEAGFAKENMDSALQKKTQFENDNDMDKLLAPNECPYTLDELNEMISKVEGSLDEIRASLVQYGRQMDDLQEQLDMRDEKEQEYRNCKQIQAEEKHKYEILGLTSDYLTRAREQFTARYMAPISNGFQKYFGILTENTDRDWQVDANISIRMKEQGQLRDVRTMSAGYKDLIGICMRFALVDAMYPGEKPFLILDDPFVNLDDEKLARGRRLLAVLSQDYQVIYFTCHGSRE